MSSNVESQVAAGDVLLGVDTKVDSETSTPKTDEVVSSEDDLVVATDSNPIKSIFKRSSSKKSKKHKENSKQELKEENKETLQTRNYFDDDTYYMNKNNERTGYALIVNNENFLTMSKRKGTAVDEGKLKQILEKLKFEVQTLNDGTLSQTEEIVREMANKDHSKSNCFLMAVFSHGEDGCICTTDGKELKIKEIVDQFRPEQCRSLLEKPKIFIFQACRGDKDEDGCELTTTTTPPTGDVTDSIVGVIHGDEILYVDKGTIPTIPSGADFLYCYSVAEGFYSHRDQLLGSWYIQDLTKAMEELIINKPDDNKKMEFLELLTNVNRMVSRRKVECTGRFELAGKKQIPCFHSLLTKKLYFN